MKSITQMPVHATAVLSLLACAAVAHAGKVTPPPPPPGAQLVRVEPGVNPEERKRNVRAHNQGHNGRNYMRDDSNDKAAQPKDDAKPDKQN